MTYRHVSVCVLCHGNNEKGQAYVTTVSSEREQKVGWRFRSSCSPAGSHLPHILFYFFLAGGPASNSSVFTTCFPWAAAFYGREGHWGADRTYIHIWMRANDLLTIWLSIFSPITVYFLFFCSILQIKMSIRYNI